MQKNQKKTAKKPQKDNKKKTAPANKQSTANPSKKSQPKKGKTGLFKFRRFKKLEGGKSKKARHPKLIVEEKNETVGYMGLTESPKRGHHKNIELEVNPQKGNSNTAYIRKEIRYTDLSNFGRILEDYNLSEQDKKKVIEYIEKLKKKK